MTIPDEFLRYASLALVLVLVPLSTGVARYRASHSIKDAVAHTFFMVFGVVPISIAGALLAYPLRDLLAFDPFVVTAPLAAVAAHFALMKWNPVPHTIPTDIVGAYAWHLENRAPTPGCYADESELPYPKQAIKDALQDKIGREPNDDRRQLLASAYIQLADWQPGVGARHVGIDLVSGNTKQVHGMGAWERLRLQADHEMMQLLLEVNDLQAGAGSKELSRVGPTEST